jgi:CRP-like cAMP-binding protein
LLRVARSAKKPVVSSSDDPPSDWISNRLLAALAAEDIKAMLPGLERVELRASHILFRAGEPARYVHFPQEALISLLVTMEDGRSAEVSLVGAEGILGIHELLGAERCRYTAVVGIPGSCLRMGIKMFKMHCANKNALQVRLVDYLRYLLLQVSQNAACNRLHRVKQRLARRLLMIHDRVGRDEFPMTHESFSVALGTPRSEVSFAAQALRFFGMIDYTHGKVIILNRQELEAASCECYNVIRREYLRLC